MKTRPEPTLSQVQNEALRRAKEDNVVRVVAQDKVVVEEMEHGFPLVYTETPPVSKVNLNGFSHSTLQLHPSQCSLEILLSIS